MCYGRLTSAPARVASPRRSPAPCAEQRQQRLPERKLHHGLQADPRLHRMPGPCPGLLQLVRCRLRPHATARWHSGQGGCLPACACPARTPPPPPRLRSLCTVGASRLVRCRGQARRTGARGSSHAACRAAPTAFARCRLTRRARANRGRFQVLADDVGRERRRHRHGDKRGRRQQAEVPQVRQPAGLAAAHTRARGPVRGRGQGGLAGRVYPRSPARASFGWSGSALWLRL